jgi:HAE1 family hydrophobic/amphiphilic exporter-1
VGCTPAGFTALFVRRPVLAVVVNVLIVLAGLAAVLGVEVRELPDIDRPVISVTTNYDGAAPETVDREVTSVIEGAMGRISGVADISSRSSFGRSRVTVEFNDATDLNVAASDARDSLGRVLNQLPDDADEPRIVKADANSDPVLRIGVTSSRMSVEALTDFVQNSIEDRLIAAPGVADVAVYGDRDRIFRIDVDQIALASRGLTVADVRDALATVAFDSPAGSLTASNQSLVVRTTATVNTPEAFGALMLDDVTRISDVATVTLGPRSGTSILRSNGQSGLGIGIIRQAQSNTLEISQNIREVVAELQPTLPEGVSMFITGDDAVFINGAIHEVEITLFLAVIIVVAVIYLFLRDRRATLIPALTIPVALIGTIAAIYMIGFSVNILTLLALVLATGLVVDDAIVVLENIVRRRSQGLGPRAAAVLGTQQVFFAVIATTNAMLRPGSTPPTITPRISRRHRWNRPPHWRASARTVATCGPARRTRRPRRIRWRPCSVSTRRRFARTSRSWAAASGASRSRISARKRRGSRKKQASRSR